MTTTRRTLLSSVLAPGALALWTGCRSQHRLRILTGGIMHESNTFHPVPTGEQRFHVLRGEEAIEGAEWAEALRESGAEIIPTLHADAQSGGIVTRAAYEKFKGEILDGARRAGPLDGVYLELHGALHVEGYPDAQVDLVEALREIVGEDAVLAASFDLHGNLSPGLAERINIMTGYRTAPHVDGVETRVRAVRLLLQALRQQRRPVTVLVQVPILIPGEKGITAAEPLKSLYAQIPAVSAQAGLSDASIFVGMPWTDVERASMSVLVVADSDAHRDQAAEQARRLAAALWDVRTELKFDVETALLDDAVSTALAAPESTVFLTDSGDNVTAGAPGDTTLVLEQLLARNVPDAVVAGIVDPAAVEACIEAGVGAQVKLDIGGKIDTVHSQPLTIEGVVQFASPAGEEEPTYEIIPGLVRPAGRAAVVQVDGILVALLSLPRAFTAPEHFQQIGIDALAHKIVVVKLGYLFQALRDVAPRSIMMLTPGAAYQLVEDLPYKNVRRPIYAIDPEMTWAP